MGLKVLRTGAAEYGQWIKALVCGEPGKGKTRFGRSWPQPFYANCEGGLMSIAHDHLPYADITSTSDLRLLLGHLEQHPEVREKLLGAPVQTLIIDTVDEIQKMLVRERLLEQKKETMSQADWGWLGDQLRGMLRQARNLDLNVILTCHLATKQDGEDGPVYVQPSIQGAVGGEIAGFVDLALLFEARPMTKVVDGEAQRVLVRFAQTFPDSRHPWVKDRSGRLPMEFELDFETDYDRMHKMIFGGIPSASEELVVKEAETVIQQAPAPAPAGAAKKAAAKKAAAPKDEAPAAAPERETATEPAPDPEKASEPDDVPSPEPEVANPPADAASEPAADAAADQAEATETVPDAGTDEAPNEMKCEECGGDIESADQSDLSKIRFRKRMCRGCFLEAKKTGARK